MVPLDSRKKIVRNEVPRENVLAGILFLTVNSRGIQGKFFFALVSTVILFFLGTNS
jgi:hypothetical protein